MEQSWIDIVMTLISNGLFPIVVAGGLFWTVVKLFNAYREDHKDVTIALQNNTATMQRLSDKIESLVDVVRKEKD